MSNTSVKNQMTNSNFNVGDLTVYPVHGVGRIEDIISMTIDSVETQFYRIYFEDNRLRLNLPVGRAEELGLRALCSKDLLKSAFETLKGRPRIKRIMWSRRAQEYEAKINSGDPVSIAEVLRDLRRRDDQNEQSYSERQIYKAALHRLARELAAVEKIDEEQAAEKLEDVLKKAA